MIVKDEEEVIERCLDSIIDHVDEIIVVDTGSLDGTTGILDSYAEAYGEGNGEKFGWVYIPWNGSFADMRNKSMDLATGDVLFIIDADEYVEEQDWKQVRDMIETPDFIVGMVQVMNVTSKGPVLGERVMQPRFFINTPEIRYKYAIHNQIDDAYIAYANKHMEETGNPALVVGIPFEIMHTGYELSPDETRAKYQSRVQICRDELEKAQENGNKRDLAYYKYQLALFLTMINIDDECLFLWDDIEYEDLNVFNRWYAKYIASRAFLRKGQCEECDNNVETLYRALGHACGMFEALHAPQTGHQALAEEPATWMITGVILIELGHAAGDISIANDGIVMLIEAFIRAFAAPQGVRCVINIPMLYNDIKNQFAKESLEYGMLDTTDLKKAVNNAREIQKSMVAFDESLLGLVHTEYLK